MPDGAEETLDGLVHHHHRIRHLAQKQSRQEASRGCEQMGECPIGADRCSERKYAAASAAVRVSRGIAHRPTTVQTTIGPIEQGIHIIQGPLCMITSIMV